MLSTENKRKLRAMAHGMPALLQIGKGGLNDNMYRSLDDDLEAHELVKVSILKTSDVEPREAAIECASMTHSDIVQIIGRTFILYRRSKENKLGIR